MNQPAAGRRKEAHEPMLFKPKIALLGILALFIVNGVAASTASAGPAWHVNGAKLEQGETRQVKLQLKFNEKFALSGKVSGVAEVEVKCHNGYSEGASIEGGKAQGQDKGKIVFEQCKTTFKPARECKVVEPIRTNQLKSFLAFNGTKPENKQQKYVDVFEPTEKTAPFVVLHFTGSECPAAEAPVEGSVAAEVLPIEQENRELLLAFPEEPITTVVHEQQERKVGLIFAGEAAKLVTAFGLRLATNEPFGVFGA